MSSYWRAVEVYGSFMRVVGEIEVAPPNRLTDVVNRVGEFVDLRNAVAEPLAINYPVLSKREPRTTVAKQSVILVCPRDQVGDSAAGNPAMWREKIAQPAAIHTQAFSMVADVHLEPRQTLQDVLERYRTDFLPVTNVSALWVASLNGETHSLQRAFALLNPASILGFSER